MIADRHFQRSSSVLHAVPAPSAGRTVSSAVAATVKSTGAVAGTSPWAPRCTGPSSLGGRRTPVLRCLLRELAPATGVAIDFGRSVSIPGDLSADGVPDLVAGSPGGQGAGTVFAFSGANGVQLWLGPEPSPPFGQLVAPSADASGDGVADVLLSGAAAVPATPPAAGLNEVAPDTSALSSRWKAAGSSSLDAYSILFERSF